MSDNLYTLAIGDVHGEAFRLQTMLDGFSKYAEAQELSYRVVFLGDIFDRGRGSRAAMDLVIETLGALPGSKLIRGNHEDLMLDAVDAIENETEFVEQAYRKWMINGGEATLHSYKLDHDTSHQLPLILDSWNHLRALREAERYVELEHHILVHAGLNPEATLIDQTSRDLMWIREPFLSSTSSFGKVVVHGHTPTKSGRAEVYPNRIAIDTHAYASGVLTAALISPGGNVSFFEARPREFRPTDALVLEYQGAASAEI